jgi:hypothetical protein
LPVACYVVGTGGMLYRQRQPPDPRQSRTLLLFLGIATFPLLLTLGFLVYWSQNIGLDGQEAFQRLSFLLAVAGAPLLASGLTIRQVVAPEPGRRLGLLRTAGTAVTFGGMAIMLTAVPLAWRSPWTTALVCSFNFVVLTVVAVRSRLPLAHAAALPCLAVGYLIGYHQIVDLLATASGGERLTAIFLSPESGAALVGLVILLAVTAELLVRSAHRVHGAFYAVGGSVLALTSLLLVSSHGIESPGRAALVTSIYAVGGLAANLRWQRMEVDYLALALAPMATLWAMLWAVHDFSPYWGCVLATESLALASIAVVARGRLLTPSAWRHAALGSACTAFCLSLAAIGMSPTEIHAGSLGILALTFLILAKAYELTALTWVGSSLLLCSFLHVSSWNTTRTQLSEPSSIAILIHASVILLAGLPLRAFAAKDSWTERLYGRPLPWLALTSSLLAPACLAVEGCSQFGHLAADTAWVAAIWLGLALLTESAPLFSAFQAAVSGSVLFGITAWLQTRPWVHELPGDLLDPRSLQAFGVGLAALGIGWLVVRLIFRKSQRAEKLLNPSRPAFDRTVLGMMMLAQFALVAWAVLPGVLHELALFTFDSDYVATIQAHSFGPGAWLVLGLLALNLLIVLWERHQREALYGLILLAVTASITWAGRFAATGGEVAGLCWALASCFVAVSLLFWLRVPLAHSAAKMRMGQDLDSSAVSSSRRLLIALTVLPVVALALTIMMVSLDERLLSSLLQVSFLARTGPITAMVLPLALICVGLTGHALRESSAGYAFSAGLIANLAVASGYYLTVVSGGSPIGLVEFVRLLQLMTLTAATWGLIALASQPWIFAWRENDTRPLARALLSLQLVLGVIGNAFLLSVGISFMVGWFPGLVAWSAEAGTPLGWAALIFTLAAVIWRAMRVGRLPLPDGFACLGLAAIGLAACSVHRLDPVWAYRTLMLGWACYMPGLVAAAWVWSRRDRAPGILGPVLAPAVVASWIRVTGIAVVLLGLHALRVRNEQLWVAAAIAVAGAAGAAMAVWRRREDWAFIAGLAVNLAASLAVWHFWDAQPITSWFIYLIQANIIAAAAVALLWLGARRLIYDAADATPRATPLLTAQVSLACGANALLLFGPCIMTILTPWNPLPALLTPIGSPVGWAALAMVTAAAWWHANSRGRSQSGHVLVVTGLLLGMLASTSFAIDHPEQPWSAYHVLLATWMGLGLTLVVAEPLSRGRDSELGAFSPFPYLASFLALSGKHFRTWMYAVGGLVLMLALRAAMTDPQRPYWSAGATLGAAAMAGAIAIRARSPGHVYLSGCFIPLAGGLAWVAWYPLEEVAGRPAALSLGYTLLLGFAVGSVFWSLVELVLRSGSTPVMMRGQLPAFVHTSAWLAVSLGGALLFASLANDLVATSISGTWILPAAGLTALGIAFLDFLWDADAPLPLAGLYATGILVCGLGLHLLDLTPVNLGWTAGLALSAYVVLTAVLGRVLPLLDELWQALRLKLHARWPEQWFLVSQSVGGIMVIGLSLWMALTFDTLTDRMAGSLAVALLVVSGIVLHPGASGWWAGKIREATLCLAVLLAVELGWAAIAPTGIAVNLHRHVALLLALATMTLFEGVALPLLLRNFETWTESARRAGPVLLAITMLVLIGLLGHEGSQFDKVTRHTPLALWETVGVAVALLGLIASGICFAVAPSTDPYGLSEQRRPLYVYTAEVLLLFLFVHVRLNVPELFGGVLTKFWPLVIMAIAFAGIGLSEFFARRGLRVLSQPLQRSGIFLPMLPVLAFWVRPPEAVHDFLVRVFPGLHPALEPLMKMQPDFGRYAIMWFCLGLLYSWVASIKKSFRFALIAALAGNFGMWALLFNAQLSFFSHPQLWMIPLALILLVSEHVNRAELGPQKSNALRYLGLIIIYVSSTADMFIAWGVNSYLPLVLAILSIVGVLTGILLRVTAFLYLGTSFLFVVVFSMIWHAAVDGRQMWLWWASGIALGALIFALFAVFEKRREDILKLIEDIKTWD